MRSQAYGFEGYSCSEHSTRYPVKERDIVDGAQRCLRRRLQQDPLSEKYYNISPYAYCANNPVNFVDPDGRFIGFISDVVSVGIGVRSFAKNISTGNIRGAVWDGVGVVVDLAAAAIPVVPGGVGYVRAGINAVDNAVDAVKAVNAVDNTADAAKVLNDAVGVSQGTDILANTQRGRMNEAKTLNDLGLPKNTAKVQGQTKNNEVINTIPDAITSDTVYEVKDVKTLSNTKQIQAQMDYAKEKGLEYKIITGTNTQVSKNIPSK